MRPARLVIAVLTALAVVGASLLAPQPAEATTKTLKVLVVPVHFGTKLDTTASAKKLVQTQAGGWFSTVSRKRVALKTTVVPVTKMKAGCSTVTDRATKLASKKGYKLSRYDLVVVLAPTCTSRAGSDSSEVHYSRSSDHPGVIALYGRKGRTLPVLIRRASEAVYDLGASHRYECYRNGRRVTVAASKDCFSHWRATQDIDVMGGGPRSGSFSAPQLDELGWLGKAEVRTRRAGSTTVALAPLLGHGVRTVKVVHEKAVYWVEYRTRSGVDRTLSSALAGVRIWRSTEEERKEWRRRRYVVVDMQPDTDRIDPLHPGSTWTSPEGLAFTTRSVTFERAVVTVRFKAAKPKAPSAPRLRAVSGDETVTARWTPRSDHGRPVTRYDVEMRDSRGRVVWRDVVAPGAPASSTAAGLLPNGKPIDVRVRARNDLGASAWSRTTATPQEQRPSVRIVAPAAKTVVDGRTVDVVLEATPHPVSKEPIAEVGVYLGSTGYIPAVRRADGRWIARVDLTQLVQFGSVSLRAVVEDANRRSATADSWVVVPQRLSPPTIVEPTAEPAIWAGDTFTVRVEPGVDRMTGEVAERVRVIVCFQDQYATAANDWTVTFDRSALRSPSGGETTAPWFWVRSQSGDWFESDWVERTIDVR